MRGELFLLLRKLYISLHMILFRPVCHSVELIAVHQWCESSEKANAHCDTHQRVPTMQFVTTFARVDLSISREGEHVSTPSCDQITNKMDYFYATWQAETTSGDAYGSGEILRKHFTRHLCQIFTRDRVMMSWKSLCSAGHATGSHTCTRAL